MLRGQGSAHSEMNGQLRMIQIILLPFGKEHMHMLVKQFPVHTGQQSCKFITTPAAAAEDVRKMRTECGINLIWNFAPTYLTETEGVHIHNENMAVSLAILTGYLRDEEE